MRRDSAGFALINGWYVTRRDGRTWVWAVCPLCGAEVRRRRDALERIRDCGCRLQQRQDGP